MFGIKPSRRNSVQSRIRRPEVEVLEDRSLLSVSPAFFIAGSAHDETAPATASSANGTSVVVWAQKHNDGNRDIIAQLYDASQHPVGGPKTVINSADDEFSPDVAMDASGNFVIVWTHDVG